MMIAEFIEVTGKRLLEFDTETVERISALRGKVFKLEVQVVDKVLYFIPAEQGVQVRDDWSGQVDVTLRGSPIGLLQFGLKQKDLSSQLFMDRRVIIEGDVELAQDFQNVLGLLDIDFEELMSRYVGDIAARQISLGVNAFREWTQDATESLKRNTREYLVEEARVLAPAWRVADFVDRTDGLRADVDRLEQRVRRLQARMG